MQPRQPAGVFGAGQFAATTHAESGDPLEIESDGLDPEWQMRLQQSSYYPPVLPVGPSYVVDQ